MPRWLMSFGGGTLAESLSPLLWATLAFLTLLAMAQMGILPDPFHGVVSDVSSLFFGVVTPDHINLFVPSIVDLKTFILGGFLDVRSSLGLSAEFQIMVWASVGMVIMSALNLSGFPSLENRPRDVAGLPGIVGSAFCHGGAFHLALNLAGFVYVSWLLSIHNPGFLPAVALIMVTAGALYWLIGPGGQGAVGASMLIMGMWSYWMYHIFIPLDGVDIAALALLAVVVACDIKFGLTPFNGSGLGHLIGVLVGIGVAFAGL